MAQHLNENPLLYELEKYRHTTLTENTCKRIMNTWRGIYERAFYNSRYECLETFMETSPDAENLVRKISIDIDKKKDYYLI